MIGSLSPNASAREAKLCRSEGMCNVLWDKLNFVASRTLGSVRLDDA